MAPLVPRNVKTTALSTGDVAKYATQLLYTDAEALEKHLYLYEVTGYNIASDEMRVWNIILQARLYLNLHLVKSCAVLVRSNVAC